MCRSLAGDAFSKSGARSHTPARSRPGPPQERVHIHPASAPRPHQYLGRSILAAGPSFLPGQRARRAQTHSSRWGMGRAWRRRLTPQFQHPKRRDAPYQYTMAPSTSRWVRAMSRRRRRAAASGSPSARGTGRGKAPPRHAPPGPAWPRHPAGRAAQRSWPVQLRHIHPSVPSGNLHRHIGGGLRQRQPW